LLTKCLRERGVINRGGRGLAPRRRAELERANRIVQRRMAERRHWPHHPRTSEVHPMKLQLRGDSIRDVMTPDPVTVATTTSLEQAARHMRDAGIGNVIVLEGERITGILTDRDIVVRAVAEGWDPSQTPVGDVASRELTTISPDETVDAAVALMRERSIRRLPVVESGQPVGIVSLGDLALERDPGSCLGEISAAPPND